MHMRRNPLFATVTTLKEKVKVVAVCPAIVNTNLIQSYLCSMGDTERTKIEPVEVALVSGETGDVV